ncbi:MAG: hypothetical protein J6B29_05655 [Clostridia bacterium]|nr:hypothetical protein [Clostridia bacterium]
MKYVSPKYNNEMIETADIICESPFSIAHVPTTVVDPETGLPTTTTATQVQVDIGRLF